MRIGAPITRRDWDCREIGGVRLEGVVSGRFSRRGRGDVAWIVRLVSIGAEGEEHSTDVMRIAKPDTLADLGTLGLSLAESKQLVAGIQREIVARKPESMPCTVRSAAAAARPAGSRTTATTRSPRRLARWPSDCLAFAAPDAARPRRACNGRPMFAPRRSWTGCGRNSPP